MANAKTAAVIVAIFLNVLSSILLILGVYTILMFGARTDLYTVQIGTRPLGMIVVQFRLLSGCLRVVLFVGCGSGSEDLGGALGEAEG
jgi:hypothetical protein